MKADRIGIFVAVLCGALALPPIAGEALADRTQPRAATAPAARTGGNAALPARATAARATAPRGAATAAKANAANKPGIRRVAITSATQRGRAYSGGGGLSCVPYARMVTGMAVSGNAAMWWHNAAGSYLRGSRPEPGSVLVFRATGGMGLGHVSVVERVVNSREILIHHSNWGGPGIRRGTVMRGVSVIDASDNNDWSAVRVQVGHEATNYGRTNPTYGFIHNRPDNGRIMRADASGTSARFEEVADAGPIRAVSTRSPHAVAHEAASIESLTVSSRR